jgi:predicted small metal-binding protein
VKTRLDCPCGEHIEAANEDELVEKTKQHLEERHPELAKEYEREHILFLAY